MPDRHGPPAPQFRPNRHVRATLTDRGGMLLDLRGRGRWFALTPTAALWWQHLLDGASLAAAAAAIADRCGISIHRVNADLQPFIQTLLRHRVIEPVSPQGRRRRCPW
jgi:Coenzyme PQQ synthesis protein D (PqqD)